MHSVVIVGTGFGAISAAIALIKRDVSDFIRRLCKRFIFGHRHIE
ncbi:MAG: NADH dehydrogenase FAD-containing subunit [Glaciecola sp.]|jgi:NADH dehydrogenase FAD-containing subunit